jgi:DNA-binding MarR family transcriptional regulator
MTSLPETRFINLLKHISTLPVVRLPEDIDLSPPAVAILFWISRSPGCGVLEVAKALGVTPPTISVGISRLVKAGWLERGSDPDDRRAHPIFLTSKGERLVAHVREHRTKMLRIFLSALTPDEQEQLLRFLERGIQALEIGLVDKGAPED